MTAAIIPMKMRDPFEWHTYVEKPMFTGRVWYRHPVYGPMYIARPNLELETKICEKVNASPNTSLLSLPYPFSNYFCNVTPWHDTVQTFFDTAGKDAIDDVMHGLETDPPRWVVYQRQMTNLKGHENIFRHGGRLPQHDLDDLLMEKVASGTWHVEVMESWPRDSQWYLIRTDAP